MPRLEVQIAAVANRLNLEISHSGRHLSPCPACKDTRRSRSDGRWPVDIYDRGLQWHCFHCGAGGGAGALGQVEPRDVFHPPSEPVPYMTAEEVREAWQSCGPLPSAALRARGISPAILEREGLARGAVGIRAPWMTRRLQLTIPAWTARGEPRGLVCRDPRPGGDGYFPAGRRREGLWMANVAALRAMTTGEAAPLGIVVEGATDFLWASCKAHPVDLPVWGGTSGAFRHLGPGWADSFVVATDADPAGDRYAKEAAGAVGGVWHFRGDLIESGLGLDVINYRAEWRAA